MRSTIFIIIIFGLILGAQVNAAAVYKFTNILCESYNKTLLVLNTCRIRAVSREKSTLTLNFTWLEVVPEVRIQIQLFKRANGYKPWLYNMNFDACEFQRKPYNPLAILFYHQIKDFINFRYQKCPIKKGHKIIDGYYPRFELFKVPLPTGDYLVAVSWYLNKKLTAHTNVSIHFVEDVNGYDTEKSLPH